MYGGYQRVSSSPDGRSGLLLARSPSQSSSQSENSVSAYSEKKVTATVYKLEVLFATVVETLEACLVWITPSFLQPRPIAPTTGQHVHDIATLDGVRGVACLIVFNFHFLFMYTRTVWLGWGVDPTGESNMYVHQLPIIRLLYGGRAMVAIFFVLSGYVLSRRPLMAVRAKSYDSMLQSLSSSVFRRGIRLYLPTIISTSLVFVAIRAGGFERATAIAQDGVTMHFVEFHPIAYATWREQARDYTNFVRAYVDFTNWGEWYNLYDPHVWTIPLEYRASMVLFLVLVCLSRARTPWRLALTAAFAVFCARWGRFEIVLFLAGALLAELDLITNTWAKGGGSSTHAAAAILPLTAWYAPTNSFSTAAAAWPTRPRRPSLLLASRSALLLTGLYLLSFPDNYPDYTPGYRRLAACIPTAYRTSTSYRFWQSVGAVLALHAVCSNHAFRRPFITPLAQYLGRVSYAFYLVHGPVLHSLGFVLMRGLFVLAGRYRVVAVDELTGRETVVESGEMGNAAFVTCLFVGWTVLLVLCVWLADIFWRVVDIPCVRLARWAENKVIREK